MKIDWNHVKLIAYYEGKLLRRNPTFIILSVVLFVVIVYFQVFYQNLWDLFFPPTGGMPLGFFRLRESAVVNSSEIPYVNAYLFCILQAFAVIFLVGSFSKGDRKNQMYDALSVRAYENREYLLGKILGVASVVVAMNTVAILIALSVNIFWSTSFLNLFYYLFYFFTLTLPALLFMVVLTVWVKTLSRSTVLATFLLLVFFVGSLSVLSSIGHGVFDFSASLVPNVFSGVTGHPFLRGYLLQRLFLLVLTLGLFSWSVYLYPRAIDRRPAVSRMLLIFGSSFLLLCAYLLPFHRINERRAYYTEVYKEYNSFPKASVKTHEITFEQRGKGFVGRSDMLITNLNDETLDSVFFYLNPRLEVSRLLVEGREEPFRKKGQVISITRELFPGEEVPISIEYGGVLDPAFAYPEIDERGYNRIVQQRGVLCCGRDFLFMEAALTLLTPEAGWYPVTYPIVDIEAPVVTMQNFTRYTLHVICPGNRTVISQGRSVTRGDTVCFVNSRNLFGISLVMGDFEKTMLSRDGVRVEIYNFKGHARLPEILEATEEGRKRAAEGILENLSLVDHFVYFSLDYPFEQLTFVESPLSLFSFSGDRKSGSGYLNSGIAFFQERSEKVTPVDYDEMEKNNQMNTPRASLEAGTINYKLYKTLKDRGGKDLLKRFMVGNNIVIRSGAIPCMTEIVELLSDDYSKKMNDDAHIEKRIKEDIPVLEYLDRASLKDALEDPGAMGLHAKIIEMKGRMLQQELGVYVDLEKLRDFTRGFVSRYRFREVSLDQFCLEFKQQLGFDLYPLLVNWYRQKGVPRFVFRDIWTGWMPGEKEEQKKSLCFKVWNQGKADGIIIIMK